MPDEHQTCSSKNQHCNELAVKALATKHDDLSSVPMFHVVEGQNQLGKVSFDTGSSKVSLIVSVRSEQASGESFHPPVLPCRLETSTVLIFLLNTNIHTSGWLLPLLREGLTCAESQVCLEFTVLPQLSKCWGYKPVPLQPNLRFSLCFVETGSQVAPAGPRSYVG